MRKTDKNLYQKLILTSLSLSLCGCGGWMKRMAIDTTAQMVIPDAVAAFYDEPDFDLAKDALPGNMKLIEALIKANPSNTQLKALAGQMFASYALGFLEEMPSPEDDPDLNKQARIKNLYTRGMNYALDSLPVIPSFRDAIAAHDLKAFIDSLALFNKTEVPALFWAAFNWSLLINNSMDTPNRIAELPYVDAMMKRVIELDEGFYYGGCHFFYIAYYAGRPATLGGDPRKAKEHYERALALNGGKMLLGDVYYAYYYAVAVQDAKLFKKVLNKVLQAPEDILPGERLTTEIAKRKAKSLLQKASDFF